MKNLLSIIALFGAMHSFAITPNDSAKFYYLKGLEEKNARRFLVASQHFEKAIEFDKTFTDAYLENGYANLEMRKTDQAKANFTKVYELQPSNTASIKELTNLYFDYRQWDKAIEFAQKCKDCGNTDRIIGMANYQKEEYVQAEKYLTKAVAKDPKDAQATYTLARAYLDMEEYKKSVPWFEKAVELDPTKSSWMNELGLLYYTNNDFKGAVRIWEKARDAGFTTGTDFNENLGYAYLYSGNYEKGEIMLTNILAKKPGNKTILRDIAQILYDQKQYDRSLDYCQKLMEKDPKDALALYQAGLCFQKLGKKDKGQAMCDQAIEMNPALASKRTKSMDIGAL
jgi:tetratricopeptide (TPR) repeat protein